MSVCGTFLKSMLSCSRVALGAFHYLHLISMVVVSAEVALSRI
jgi:hypothetical protein